MYSRLFESLFIVAFFDDHDIVDYFDDHDIVIYLIAQNKAGVFVVLFDKLSYCSLFESLRIIDYFATVTLPFI